MAKAADAMAMADEARIVVRRYGRSHDSVELVFNGIYGGSANTGVAIPLRDGDAHRADEIVRGLRRWLAEFVEHEVLPKVDDE